MNREEAVVLLDHVINLKGALTKSEDAKETVDLIRDFMAEKAKTGESTTSLSFKDQTKNYASEAKKLPTLPPPLKAGPSTGTAQT